MTTMMTSLLPVRSHGTLSLVPPPSPSTAHVEERYGIELDWLSFTLTQTHGGALINKKGGYYHPGKQYPSSIAETKTAVGTMRLAEANTTKKKDRT